MPIRLCRPEPNMWPIKMPHVFWDSKYSVWVTGIDDTSITWGRSTRDALFVTRDSAAELFATVKNDHAAVVICRAVRFEVNSLSALLLTANNVLLCPQAAAGFSRPLVIFVTHTDGDWEVTTCCESPGEVNQFLIGLRAGFLALNPSVDLSKNDQYLQAVARAPGLAGLA